MGAEDYGTPIFPLARAVRLLVEEARTPEGPSEETEREVNAALEDVRSERESMARDEEESWHLHDRTTRRMYRGALWLGAAMFVLIAMTVAVGVVLAESVNVRRQSDAALVDLNRTKQRLEDALEREAACELAVEEERTSASDLRATVARLREIGRDLAELQWQFRGSGAVNCQTQQGSKVEKSR